LLAPGKTRVTLLEVVTMNPQETEAEAESRARPGLEALLARLPHGVEAAAHVVATPRNSDIARVIGETAGKLGAEAIASATHGHSAKRHVVAGSTALGMVERSGLPVLLVKSSATE
jgi:nucleotide-binding universal stress UspA family protein